ncbi:hypothetical protein ACEPPN_007434 [Leptodophora sp. 'Broadleaf-Isolate-01']
MRWFLSVGAVLAAGVTGDNVDLASRSGSDPFTPSRSRWPGGLHLAVDYYPSHWPESMWEPDVARMRDANISYVRVNEFDWAVLEPTEGQYNFTLLDQTVELLGRYNLKAIIGTPTATPPNWLTEKYDVAFVDKTNTTRLFGSRRHYSFSSFDYRNLSQNITRTLAQRYGNNSNVVAWQLDNEFGCHDTTRTYDHNAISRFRIWLQQKYGTIENMNRIQGRVFWSSQYASFETVHPPMLEVAAPNSLHTLDWNVFSSDMVIDFAKEQVQILRQYAPNQAITTNFMMPFFDFDHYKFGREVGLDFATYDEYPLGATQQFSWLSPEQETAYLRTGIIDYQAFHHALYRSISGSAYGTTAGPFGITEMQPGVLSWNTYRVSPLPGMVRLWTHETFAASGDMVNYFRFRQVPYAQEQPLSGLFTSDNMPDVGFSELQMVADEDLPILRDAGISDGGQGDVALVFDYISNWMWDLVPYSGGSSPNTQHACQYFDVVYRFYSALRRLGLSIDVISPEQALDNYKMVVVPSMPFIHEAFNTALASYSGPVVFGPHTGSKTAALSADLNLNPGNGTLGQRLPMRVSRVETPPDYAHSGVTYASTPYNISGWEENLACTRGNQSSNVTITYTTRHLLGRPAACTKDGLHYIAFKPPVELLIAYLGEIAASNNLTDLTGKAASQDNDLGDSLRLARRGDLLWVFNYGLESVASPNVTGAELLLGESGDIPSAGLAVWQLPAQD